MALYESYSDELISREKYLTEREAVNCKIADIEKQIQALELEFERLPSYTLNFVEQIYNQLSETIEITKEIVDCLVDSVIIYSADRIEIRLKTTDELYVNNTTKL